MCYLYATRSDLPTKLVATFDTEPQLLAYVRWATLSGPGRNGAFQFEKGSALASYHGCHHSLEPLTDDDPALVDHNPTPSML
ncbi:MAG: hypothetical protein ABI353_24265 [Isosphaeraceae bacterium]